MIRSKQNRYKVVTAAARRLLSLSYNSKVILQNLNLIKFKNPKKSTKLNKAIVNCKKLQLKKESHINHLQMVYKIQGNPNLASF
jgi:hypothetical protein